MPLIACNYIKEETKRKFLLRTHNHVGFILRAKDCRFSMMCRLGPITLSKGIGFPIFSQLPLILVDLHPFLPTCSHFFTMYPNFGTFYALGFFIDPQFCAPIFWAAFGTPVMLLSLTGSGFVTQLPQKNWVSSRSLSFGLFP